MADMDITNPDGAFGFTALDQQLGRRYFELEAASDVSAGYIVAIDTAGKVAHAATTLANQQSFVIGVAENAARAASSANGFKPGIVRVVTEGYAEVAVSGATTAGSFAVASVTTAGILFPVAVTANTTANKFIGRVIETDAVTTLRTVGVWVSVGSGSN